jgi:hypothetical protein
MSESPKILCPQCESLCVRVISGGSGFVLKGADWPSKSLKLSTDRDHKSQELEVKQYQRYGLDGGMRLVPNVDGEVTDNWNEAKQLAKAKGKVDPMYDHMIFREAEKAKITTKDQVGFRGSEAKKLLAVKPTPSNSQVVGAVK